MPALSRDGLRADAHTVVLMYRLPRPQTLAEAWALLAIQAEELATLRAQLQNVTARLGQNSSNSSRSPSSDPPNRPPRPPRSPSGRPPGGQPGHVGHGRPLRPQDQVDHVVAARPVAWAACGTLLLGEDPDPARHQVTELPVVRPVVTEYQRHTSRTRGLVHALASTW